MNALVNRGMQGLAHFLLILATCQGLASHQVIAQKLNVSSPDFGANVYVFNPKMPIAEMQAKINEVYTKQEHSEFGVGRYAFLFAPGEYKLNVPVGFYTQVAGLGATPNEVHIAGDMHADAALPNNNATTTFWRAVEGLSVTPTGGAMQWAVSQAVSFRRMHVMGDLALHQKHGWASGGWMSDSVVDGTVDSGSQQQWISRNDEWRKWTGSNWNMVFVGVPQVPAGEWPEPPFTKVERTPVVREKPFLMLNAKGSYSVRVPAIVRDSAGVTWHDGSTPGRSVPLGLFYIAHAERDSAGTMNAALREGRNLLLTPGIYGLDEPLQVDRKDTIVLGLGFATLHPVKGTAAIEVADVDGVTVSGLLLDAGETRSPELLRIGKGHSELRHKEDPVSLHDVFFRVGGAAVGKTVANLVIDSNDVLVDHTWIWRADHGTGVGWSENESANGLVVNGSDVTIYGLFVEHHQKYQVLWNGERGRTYFYQSEIPYDPPNQASWKSSSDKLGWASYKVANEIKIHEAWGLGVYSVFTYPNVVLSQAIEAPQAPGVRFTHMITVALADKGEILSVIDGKGGAAITKPRSTPKVAEFPEK
jgi:hypothetical protein